MSRQWTAAQSAAINTTDKTLLISAAAGSGKTATLTQRIINRLTDPDHPGDLSSMLVVTFTQAAAAELKSRIFAALGEALSKDPANRHLTEQLIKLGNARICTIDSFYLELIRSHFSELGLSPNFRIADPTELELLALSVMEETIDRFYETDELVVLLSELLVGHKNPKKLSKTLIHLSERIATLPEGVEFIRQSAERAEAAAEEKVDFLSTDFGQLLRRETLDTVFHHRRVFEEACAYAQEELPAVWDSYAYDLAFCDRLLAALQHPTMGYRYTQEVLQSHQPLKLKGVKKEEATDQSDMFKELRRSINTSIKKKLTVTFSRSNEELCEMLRETARMTRTLYRVLAAYEAAMDEEKQRRNVLNFNDIRRNTLRLLVKDGTPTEVAKHYAMEFSEIYIDEYQDVDRVQDLIFRSIAKPDNRFMVGDIKQSIYAFRGAEPSLFADYRRSFPPLEQAADSPTATIFMSENFRCDETVIDFTNRICSLIFSACHDSIQYQESDNLRLGKKPPSEDYRPTKVQVTVLTCNEEELPVQDEEDEDTEPLAAAESEAEYIAEEIARLLGEKTKKANGELLEPGDIAVLFRTRTISPFLTRALNRRGILTSDSDSECYFENPDVLMTLCLLNTVDNPHRDIFLSGTLRSPLFGFTMNDLIRIRGCADPSASLYDALLICKEGTSPLAEQCATFDQMLTELRTLSTSLSVDRFLRVLFESELFVRPGFVTAQTEDGAGGNLLRLYEYARTFESSSFKGLYNFIEFINTLIEEGQKLKLPPKGRTSDRVILSTVHMSKGLEFPVCFVCGTGSPFNETDPRSPLLYSYPTGVAMKLLDSTGFARINTPMRDALARSITVQGREEQMRVLYVALTRAVERLYVVGFSRRSPVALMEKAKQQALFCTRHAILSCHSYLQWILLGFAKTPALYDCATLTFARADMVGRFSLACDPLPKEEPPAQPDEALYEWLREKYVFRYPYAHLQRIPAKLSVSKLSPDILDEDDTSRELFPEHPKTTVPDFFLGKTSSRAPANERGTATHLFLQFCDFARAKRYGISEELARLVTEQFLPENIAELVYQEELEHFLHSELADRILNAKQVLREQRFNLLMDADGFTKDPVLIQELKGEKLAVQGVIDLILLDEDGSLSLFDYKTDRLSEEEHRDPTLAAAKMNRIHGRQLSYYAYAAEQIFGKPCRRLCVYATCSATLYDITRQPPLCSEDFLDTL